MAQVAIHEAKKALRRELKKRIAGMSDDVKLKESASIVNKVSIRPFYSYGSEAEGDLVLIQAFLLYYLNQVILILSSIFQEQFP